MRIDRHVCALSLVVTLFGGCSNSTPPAAPAPAPELVQAAPAITETSRINDAPAVVSRPPAAKAKRTPPSDLPVERIASAPVEAPRETAVNVPAVLETPNVPAPSPEPTFVRAPAPPPEPTTRQVTIPSGTAISVRMSDAVDSETARVGQTFRATLDVPLAADRETVVPRGTDVYLRLTHVESAGSLTGRSEVSLELDRIVIGGKSYTVASNTYEKQGASQTVETAKKTGIGAAIGAAVGAIAGGKKGAAIGAGVGGGTGVAIEAATKGKQVRVEPESRVDFYLEQPLEVIVDSGRNSSTQRDSSSGPRLLSSRRSAPATDEIVDDIIDDSRLELSGRWKISMDSPQGNRNLDLTLRESGDRLDGTLFDRGRGQALRGNVRGDSISFSTDAMRFEGRIVGARLRGTVTLQGEGRRERVSNQTFNWTAERND
jgi:hypothetical protein